MERPHVLVLALALFACASRGSDPVLTTDGNGSLHINTSANSASSVFINGLDIGTVCAAAWHLLNADDHYTAVCRCFRL